MRVDKSYNFLQKGRLARGIVRDGLPFQSIDTGWMERREPVFRGDPCVGFVARPDGPILVLRAEALEHLLSIVRTARKPSRKIRKDEFVLKDDFKKWLIETGQYLPSFWFSANE